jgi:hypothetical protein
MEKILIWLSANPWLNLLGVVLGLFSIILAVIFYLKSRRDKRPYYSLKNTVLISNWESLIDGLEVKYAGVPISNLSLTHIAFGEGGEGGEGEGT